MLKRLQAVAFLVSLVAFVDFPAYACSYVCGGGDEMRRDFTVMITHKGKPLAGVVVAIDSTSDGNVTLRRKTGKDGIARISNLRAGSYWLSANLLDIPAVVDCFHIAKTASPSAKSSVTIVWGESPIGTSRVAGHLIDSAAAKGGTLLDMAYRRNRVESPSHGARISLHNAITGMVYVTISDQGSFTFDQIPEGTFVLKVEGVPYQPTNLLIEVAADASLNSLELMRTDLGMCGSHVLQLRNQ